MRTSKVKARTLVAEHRHGARRLARLVEHPERFLNPVLLLVLICQLVAATLVGVLASRWFPAAFGIIIATVFEVVVVFVVFEAVPKNYAVRNTDRAALLDRPRHQRGRRLPAGAVALLAARRARRPAHGQQGRPQRSRR